MRRPITSDEIEAAAHALIKARSTNLGIEVSMPVIYPDGRSVTVVVTVDGGDYIVHDSGFGAMFLTAAGVSLTKQLRRRLAGLAAHYGCAFVENRMTRRATVDQLAVAIALVANASRTVGDQSLETRAYVESTFRRDLRERLREVAGERLRPDEEFRGASGSRYRVSNVLLDKARRHPVAFIEPFHTRSVIPSKITEFFDLHGRHEEIACVSVYDDAEDWRPEDLRLISQVSEAVAYSQSEPKIRQLAA